MKGAALLVPAILLVGVHAGDQPDKLRPVPRLIRCATADNPAPVVPRPRTAPTAPPERLHAGPAQGTRGASSRKYCSTIPKSCSRCRTRSKPRWTRSRPSAWPWPSRRTPAELFRPACLACRRQCQGRRTRDRVLRLQLRLLQESASGGRPAGRQGQAGPLILKEFPILARDRRRRPASRWRPRCKANTGSSTAPCWRPRGRPTRPSALRVAEKLGLDMARLKKDMASPEVKKEIDDTRQLATKMGIQGTPHFIVGDRIIAGRAGEPHGAARASTSPTSARRAARSADAPGASRPLNRRSPAKCLCTTGGLALSRHGKADNRGVSLTTCAALSRVLRFKQPPGGGRCPSRSSC